MLLKIAAIEVRGLPFPRGGRFRQRKQAFCVVKVDGQKVFTTTTKARSASLVWNEVSSAR